MPEECIKVFVRVRPFTEKETAKGTDLTMQATPIFCPATATRSS